MPTTLSLGQAELQSIKPILCLLMSDNDPSVGAITSYVLGVHINRNVELDMQLELESWHSSMGYSYLKQHLQCFTKNTQP